MTSEYFAPILSLHIAVSDMNDSLEIREVGTSEEAESKYLLKYSDRSPTAYT